MTIYVVYFIVVLGLGLIFFTIGFLSGPNHLKKRVPVTTLPLGNTGDKYTLSNYRGEEQGFLNELENRPVEQKSNQGDDYQREKERRDVVAFSECCNAGLLENLNTGDLGQ